MALLRVLIIAVYTTLWHNHAMPIYYIIYYNIKYIIIQCNIFVIYTRTIHYFHNSLKICCYNIIVRTILKSYAHTMFLQ